AGVYVAVEGVAGTGIDLHFRLRPRVAVRLDVIGRSAFVVSAEVEQHRCAQRLTQVRLRARTVVGHGRQPEPGIGEQGDAAAPAEADRGDLQAVAAQRFGRVADDVHGAVHAQLAHQLAPPCEAGLVVAKL